MKKKKSRKKPYGGTLKGRGAENNGMNTRGNLRSSTTKAEASSQSVGATEGLSSPHFTAAPGKPDTEAPQTKTHFPPISLLFNRSISFVKVSKWSQQCHYFYHMTLSRRSPCFGFLIVKRAGNLMMAGLMQSKCNKREEKGHSKTYPSKSHKLILSEGGLVCLH